mgnify:CR=1 FL=1
MSPPEATPQATVKPTRPTVPAIPQLIQRYLDGESVTMLAKDHRVTRRTIYQWMHKACNDRRYHDLITQGLVARMADADTMLEEADDAVSIARAREIAKYCRWDLERRRPQQWGTAQGDQGGATVHIPASLLSGYQVAIVVKGQPATPGPAPIDVVHSGIMSLPDKHVIDSTP